MDVFRLQLEQLFQSAQGSYRMPCPSFGRASILSQDQDRPLHGYLYHVMQLLPSLALQVVLTLAQLMLTIVPAVTLMIQYKLGLDWGS
jgi:hypothetical protein